MRKILFRGKEVGTGEWVYGYYVHFDGGILREGESVRLHDYIFIPGGLSLYASVIPNTVGQFTGMKDKKGNPIYEGDIVLKRTYNGKNPFRVTFGGGMFHCGFGGGSSTATHRYTLDDRYIEVIGNVFDNPELL